MQKKNQPPPRQTFLATPLLDNWYIATWGGWNEGDWRLEKQKNVVIRPLRKGYQKSF